MTAGPIERALRFLKSTSVNALEEGAGVTEADNGGVVLAGDPAGGEPAAAGAEAGGDSSCAKIKPPKDAKNKPRNRIFIQ
jgi:hypothetical protein